ncbi:MAG: calcium-binding protein [Baekduia sp.]
MLIGMGTRRVTGALLVLVLSLPVGVAAARENRREKPRATQIAGTSGSDTLDGTANADVIRGKSGNDTLDGGAGDDTVSGDGGNDVIRGGAGRDVLLGGAGNDKIFARDGEADTIACGRGRDVVQADRADTITGECEVVRAQ